MKERLSRRQRGEIALWRLAIVLVMGIVLRTALALYLLITFLWIYERVN